MNADINKLLSSVQVHLKRDSRLRSEKAAPTSKKTETPLSEALDVYLTEVADLLAVEHNLTSEEAVRFVFNAADALAEEGSLPVVPDDGAPVKQIAEWIERARKTGFAHGVLSRARDLFEV